MIIPVEYCFNISSAHKHGSRSEGGHLGRNDEFEIRDKAAIVGQLQQLTGPGHGWMLTGASGAICITTLHHVAETGDRLIFGFSLSRNANSKLLADPLCSAVASAGTWRFSFRTRFFDSICGGPVTGLVARVPMVLGIVSAGR